MTDPPFRPISTHAIIIAIRRCLRSKCQSHVCCSIRLLDLQVLRPAAFTTMSGQGAEDGEASLLCYICNQDGPSCMYWGFAMHP